MRSKRSASHPVYSIKYCLDLVELIYKNFGSNYYAKRNELAEIFEQSAATLQQRVGSSVQYGLLDLVPKEGYKVSDLFTRYHRPSPPEKEERRKVLLTAFKNPTVYSKLIEQFEGDILPAQKALSNILFQHFNISDRACEKAAEVFYDNVVFLDLIGVDNVFRLNDKPPHDIEEAEVIDVNGDNTSDKGTQSREVIPSNMNKESGETATKTNIESQLLEPGMIPFNIPLNFKERRTAKIIIPDDIKVSDFETIINWIRLMKDSYE